MDLQDLKRKTDLSRPGPLPLDQPLRKPDVPFSIIQHAVILEFPPPDPAPDPAVDPYDDTGRAFKVGFISPDSDFPSDDGGYVFLTHATGRVRLFDVFCEPDLRRKHYAQWLWQGVFDADAPVFLPSMRVLKVYTASGLLYCEYASRIRYTRLLGGFTPSDCYVNQVT